MGGNLYAASGGDGVWSSPLSGIALAVGEGPDEALPGGFVLSQNYPNPFNPATTIGYGLPRASYVMLTIYNSLGQQVAQPVNEEQQAGYHETVFRGDGLASGAYFYRFDARPAGSGESGRAGTFTIVKRLLFLK